MQSAPPPPHLLRAEREGREKSSEQLAGEGVWVCHEVAAELGAHHARVQAVGCDAAAGLQLARQLIGEQDVGQLGLPCSMIDTSNCQSNASCSEMLESCQCSRVGTRHRQTHCNMSCCLQSCHVGKTPD